MSLELIHCQPDEVTLRRMARVLKDVRALAGLSAATVRTLYSELEMTRDVLSKVLDKADGKYPD